MQEKGGKNQLKPFLSQEKWSFLLGSHPVFLPFFPCRKAFHHTCPMCQFFSYFFYFFPSEAFFYSISIVSQIHPHLARTSFPLKGEICYFDFVLADGSRQWGTPKIDFRP